MTANDADVHQRDPATPLIRHMTVLTNSTGETLYTWTGPADTLDAATSHAKRSYLAASKAMDLAYGLFALVPESNFAVCDGASVELPASTGWSITVHALEWRLALHAQRQPIFEFAVADRLVHSAALADRACLQEMSKVNSIAIVLPYFVRHDVIVLNPARIQVNDNETIDLFDRDLTDALMYLSLTCLMAHSATIGHVTFGPGRFQFPITPGSAGARAAALMYRPKPANALLDWLEQLSPANPTA